jgi:hypothetical protein
MFQNARTEQPSVEQFSENCRIQQCEHHCLKEILRHSFDLSNRHNEVAEYSSYLSHLYCHPEIFKQNSWGRDLKFVKERDNRR